MKIRKKDKTPVKKLTPSPRQVDSRRPTTPTKQQQDDDALKLRHKLHIFDNGSAHCSCSSWSLYGFSQNFVENSHRQHIKNHQP